MTKSIYVGVENTNIAARIVPHKTDDSRVMLKSIVPLGGVWLAELMGISIGKIVKGENYFMVEINKNDFVENAHKLLDIRDVDVPKLESKHLSLFQKYDLAEVQSESDNGKVWKMVDGTILQEGIDGSIEPFVDTTENEEALN